MVPPAAEEWNTTTEIPNEIDENDTMNPYYTTLGIGTSLQPSGENDSNTLSTLNGFGVTISAGDPSSSTSNDFEGTTMGGINQYTTISPLLPKTPGIF
jgi:hypothetical protein